MGCSMPISGTITATITLVDVNGNPTSIVTTTTYGAYNAFSIQVRTQAGVSPTVRCLQKHLSPSRFGIILTILPYSQVIFVVPRRDYIYLNLIYLNLYLNLYPHHYGNIANESCGPVERGWKRSQRWHCGWHRYWRC